MSVASTVDDLRGFVTRSSGRNARRTPKNVCGESTISEAEGVFPLTLNLGARAARGRLCNV